MHTIFIYDTTVISTHLVDSRRIDYTVHCTKEGTLNEVSVRTSVTPMGIIQTKVTE